MQGATQTLSAHCAVHAKACVQMTSVQVSKVLGSSTPAQQRTRSRRFTAEREQGTHSAEVVVAGTLAVELARAEVDVLHARPPISEKHTVTNNNRRKRSKLSLILQRA